MRGANKGRPSRVDSEVVRILGRHLLDLPTGRGPRCAPRFWRRNSGRGWGSESIMARLKSGTGQVAPPGEDEMTVQAGGLSKTPSCGKGTRTSQADCKASECWQCPSVEKSTSRTIWPRRRTPNLDRTDSVGARSAISVVVAVLLCRARAMFWLRSVRPQLTAEFSDAHDRQMWECFCHLVGIASVSARVRQSITVPLSLGGVGLSMCQKGERVSTLVELGRFPSNDLESPPHRRDHVDPRIECPSHTNFQRRRSNRLQSVGFHPPSWEDLAKGEQPPEEDVESQGDRNIP